MLGYANNYYVNQIRLEHPINLRHQRRIKMYKLYQIVYRKTLPSSNTDNKSHSHKLQQDKNHFQLVNNSINDGYGGNVEKFLTKFIKFYQTRTDAEKSVIEEEFYITETEIYIAENPDIFVFDTFFSYNTSLIF